MDNGGPGLTFLLAQRLVAMEQSLDPGHVTVQCTEGEPVKVQPPMSRPAMEDHAQVTKNTIILARDSTKIFRSM